jgi:hypothetical protein
MNLDGFYMRKRRETTFKGKPYLTRSCVGEDFGENIFSERRVNGS